MKILFEKKIPIESIGDISFDIWNEEKEHVGAIQPEVLVVSGVASSGGVGIALYTANDNSNELTGILTESLEKGKISTTVKSDGSFGPVAYDVTGTYNGEYTLEITEDAEDNDPVFEGCYVFIKVLYED